MMSIWAKLYPRGGREHVKGNEKISSGDQCNTNDKMKPY